MTVFSKVSKIVLPVAVIGGGMFLALNTTIEKANKENNPEYLDVGNRAIKSTPKYSMEQGLENINKEVEKRIEEKRKQEEKRVAEMKKRIADEIARVKEKDRQKELAKQKAIQEAKRKEEIKRQQQHQVKKNNNSNQGDNKVDINNQSGWMTFNGSYYGNDCAGCSGITATGMNVRNTIYYQDYRIIALDPRVIPLWSIVEVQTPNEIFKAVVGDTGGAIKGYKADILVQSESYASQLGRHNIQIRVIGKLK